MSGTQIHPTAQVDESASIGEGTSLWNWSTVREGAQIGARCTIGQSVYIDHDVVIGDECKIQNGVSIYFGVTLGERVFVGPAVAFTNDRHPRAATTGWVVETTIVEDDASIGANATIVCGTRLGAGCVVGAGAVVTRDVPAQALVVGNPARVIDYVALDGSRLHRDPLESPSSGGVQDRTR